MTNEAHDFFAILQGMSVITDCNDFSMNYFQDPFSEEECFSDDVEDIEADNDILMKNVPKNFFPDTFDGIYIFFKFKTTTLVNIFIF